MSKKNEFFNTYFFHVEKSGFIKHDKFCEKNENYEIFCENYESWAINKQHLIVIIYPIR